VARSAVVGGLLASPEPSVRWKTRIGVLGESETSARILALQEEVRDSPRVRALLQRRGQLGRPSTARGVYYKWQGAHWALARLADLGYPPGDPSLFPLRDRVLELWLRTGYYREFETATKSGAYRKFGVPRIDGRYRRCASQQGNALYYLTKLGLDDGRCENLAERLIHWQWPDGGWNCDRNPSADTSSFLETLLPMLGLAVHGERSRSRSERESARRASEVFLRRRLFKRISTAEVIDRTFVRLHYPTYYHYDILAGLRGMAEVGRIRDRRCEDALDLLENKRLPDGGWPAEAKFYRFSPGRFAAGSEFVDWGGTSSRRSNPWVTVEALSILTAAGRFAA